MNHRIAWLVPFPIKGSGGHRTIFSHIQNLINRGHLCHVYVGDEEKQGLQPTELQELVEDYFGPCAASFHVGYQISEHYDLAVATAWWTAPIVAHLTNARNKIYFVQDFEPWFHPMGDQFILAENTYRLGLVPVTIGRWLAHLMRDRYNTPSYFFEFTADQTTYKPLPEIEKQKAICFVFQPEKPRRCPAIGRDALAIVKHHCPDIRIYTFGSEEPPDFWFDHSHLGILSLEQCNILYNRCCVGLCLSSSNPSRIPFEMMAAGLPVVDFYADNTIYDLPDHAVLLSERDPAIIADALVRILNSNSLQQSMHRAGQDFMLHRHADQEYEQCATIFESILAGTEHYHEKILPLYTTSAHNSRLSSHSLPAIHRTGPPDMPHQTKNLSYYWLCNNRLSRALKILLRGSL